MFVDVSIKYTQSELKECQELLTFLSRNPQIKADAEADEAIEQAHREATEAKPKPQAKQEEGGVSWRNTTGGWTTNECTEEETVTEKAAEEEPVKEKEYTYAEVTKRAREFMNSIGKDGTSAFKVILNNMGYEKASEVPKGKYPELMEAINNAK